MDPPLRLRTQSQKKGKRGKRKENEKTKTVHAWILTTVYERVHTAQNTLPIHVSI